MITYISKGGTLEKNHVLHRLGKYPQVPEWEKEDAHKSVPGANPSLVEKIFRDGCYVNFPCNRYEYPYWNTEDIRSNFEKITNEKLGKPISVQTSFQDIEFWLINVIADFTITFSRELRTKNLDQVWNTNYVKNNLYVAINILLETILSEQNATLSKKPIGTGTGNIYISDGNQKVIVPSLEALSAGQAMLLGIFSTILRYISIYTDVMPTEEAQGIVLVDEIDAHIHTDLLYNILPELIQMFPKIQFIVTSHSPLFALGMEKKFGTDGFSLIELPNGNKITAERFSEFLSSFEYYEQTKLFDEKVMSRFGDVQRPLILCEGKTDPIYLKAASELLGFDKLANDVDFDWIGRLEDGQSIGGGSSKLSQAYKTLQNNIKILKTHTFFLFDCDQNKQDIDDRFLHVYTIKRNDANNRCNAGIENLLPEEVFEDRFYKTECKLRGADEATIKKFKKVDLCKYLCEEKREPSDFENFRTVLETIQSACFPEKEKPIKLMDNPNQSL